MPRIIAYIRVSTDKQDLDKQKFTILDYAHKNNLKIDEFYELEISSKQNTKDRRIIELLETLNPQDTLLLTEVSRMGRNMLQVLNIMEKLNQNNVKVIFINQPELSTVGQYGTLLLAIYSYFAQAEREFISMRTKQGLQALKDRGIKLGRPKGFAKSKLDPFEVEIRALLANGSTKVFIASRYNTTVGNLKHFMMKKGIVG